METQWINVLFAVITTILLGVLAWAGRAIKKQYNALSALRKGVLAMMRDRLIQAYRYFKQEGECPIHEMDVINSMYTEYVELDGNSIHNLERIMNELNQLPTQKS